MQGIVNLCIHQVFYLKTNNWTCKYRLQHLFWPSSITLQFLKSKFNITLAYFPNKLLGPSNPNSWLLNKNCGLIFTRQGKEQIPVLFKWLDRF